MAAATLMLGIILTGCVELYAPAGPVTGLTASQDEEDRIIISWDPVARAGGYAIYRSRAEDGEFERIASTSAPGYIDTTVGPELVYWYAIAVIPFAGASGTVELSMPVSGTSTHVFAWTTSTRQTGASTAAITLDMQRAGELYAAAAGEAETSISVDAFGPAGWSGFGDPVGTINAELPGGFAMAAVDRVVYVAYADRTRSGSITVTSRVLHDEEPDSDDADDEGSTVESNDWTFVGSAGFGVAPTGRLNLVATADGELLVTSRTGDSGGYAIQAFRWDGAAWSTENIGVPGGQQPVQHRLAVVENTISLVFEDQASGDPSTLRLYRYVAETGWSEEAPFSRSSGTTILEGAVSIDAAPGRLVAAFVDESTGLGFASCGTSGWVEIAVTRDADLLTGIVAAATDGNRDYLFYRDAASLAGLIERYDGTSWSQIPATEDEPSLTTSLSLSALMLETVDNRLYAGYIDGSGFGGSGFSVSVYQ